MKTDRLISILIFLLQREKTTAPELAERFQVSRRTIQRDIDDLCLAGIPIVTKQGGNGGISIWEGYKLDKAFLTKDELQDIIVGLKGMDSVSKTSKLEQILLKLSPNDEAMLSLRDSIIIDLASYYKTSLSEKIGKLKTGVKEKRVVSFEYYSEKGIDNRSVEPYYIVFKWASWYLFGYCKKRNDFRLFKLNRMWNLALTEEVYKPRAIPQEKSNLDAHFDDSNKIKIIFDRSVEHLVIDTYGPNNYVITEQNEIELTIGFTNRDYIISWILGFGEKARVAEPKDIAIEIKRKAEKIIKNYEQDI
ncbi:YafY family protein [Wukongibacter baidiensis]|uniref:helix-turn-helix transcriptional regulator n=1 Tax=Wukongibacter baidiensis TaxID=1723361 RepID=UPI003D7F7A4F